MIIQLKDIPSDGVLLEGVLPAADYELPLEDYKGWETIKYRFFVNILGSECLVSGALETHLHAPCARCLELIPLDIRVENFQHSFDITGLESIDLTQTIREDILLGLPLAPRCQLDKDFRCPLTGAVHKETADEFAALNRESVWGKLENLKKKKE